MKNAREAAFEILSRIEKDGSYSNLMLDKVQKENNLTGRDASFCTALVYGVLERRLMLDYIIRQYSSVRLKKIEAGTLIILRMGVYQLLFMDSVHSGAAVNESVSLAKKNKLYKSSGFINAVLRSFVRAECKYKLPEKIDKAQYLSVVYSCPKEIVSLWLESYGEEITEKILGAFMGRQELCVRVNTKLTTADELLYELTELGVKAEKSKISSNALLVSGTGSVDSLEPFKSGKMYVQDISSVICTELANPQKGFRVADVCAAPGSKSFSMALLMEDEGEVHSFDLYPHKAQLIRKGAERLNINIIKAEVRDATSKDSVLSEACDLVLCDAPCSGLGVLGRKPEIRYKSFEEMQNLPSLQYEILTNSAKLVKAGGKLVYSTCTLNPMENGEIADRFLSEHKDFEACELTLPENIKRGINESGNQLTLFPHINGTDGFFVSAFRRKAGVSDD